MTLRGRGRKSVRRMMGSNSCRATFLCIMVIGLVLCSSLDVVAYEAADLRIRSEMEPEMMRAQLSPLDAWLQELGFVYDETLGRVRNPFDFPYAEADTALHAYSVPSIPVRIGQRRTIAPQDLIHQEQFVSLDGNILKVIVGADGSGKTAHLLMLTHLLGNRPVIMFQGPAAFAVMQRCANSDFPAQTIYKFYGEADIILDLSIDSNSASEVVTPALEKIYSSTAQSNFYIALPQKFRSMVKQYPSWEIRWNPASLSYLLRQRLLWASEGISTISNLGQICDTSIVDPHWRLAKLAKTPRHLFNLGQYLLHSHLICTSSTKPLLEKRDWFFLVDYALVRTSRAPGYYYPSSFVEMILSDGEASPLEEAPRLAQTSNRLLEDLNELLKQVDVVALENLIIVQYQGLADKLDRGLRRDEVINLFLDYCRRNPDRLESAIKSVRMKIEEERR